MKTRWELNKEAFDRLLDWLDPDRDRAGEIYVEIRRKLIRIFLRRGCTRADELSDETINRVTRKVEEIAPTYVGDPARFFYGVAQKVYLEYLSEKPPPPHPPPTEHTEESEGWEMCVKKCMNRLAPANRRMIVEYFKGEKGAKIAQRKELAVRLGIELDTLRMRVHRIRARLLQCAATCLDQHKAA
jgi:DNA-directed RNA polymerase specialized sigma24 family protein